MGSKPEAMKPHPAALLVLILGVLLKCLAIFAALLDFALEGWPFTAMEYHDVWGAFVAFVEIATVYGAGMILTRVSRSMESAKKSN